MPNNYDEAEISFLLQQERSGDYYYQPAKVSACFREAVKAICPFPFTGTRDANFCLHLLQYLLFPTLFQQGTTRIAVPCRTLAVLDGLKWTHNYRAIDRLTLFAEKTHVRLNINPWDYSRGLARTVQPDWPAALITARDEELERFALRRSRVYFDTGEPYGQSRRAKQERLHFREMRRQQAFLASLLDDDHPQRPILQLLNSQSEVALRKIIKKNLDTTRLHIFVMPQNTPEERLSRSWAMTVLDAVTIESTMTYRGVEKTARVFTIGTTLHQLPREARKLLLSGCTTLDLKAAQLAIAAKVWDVPALRDRLRNGDHWPMLLREINLAVNHKPAIKTATYALLFGMSLRGKGRRKQAPTSGVIFDLIREYGGPDAREAAERFASHPVTASLVEARDRRMKRVATEGGLTTVYGKYIPVPSSAVVEIDSSEYHAEMRSALAQELQAYEQKLMQPIIEIVAARRGVAIISYLHDGVTLHFEDSGKRAPTVSKMCKEVAREAVALGIETTLEEERESGANTKSQY